MSDFGRTPKVNANAGRDHWTFCYSMLFSGAGIRGGTVYGASDSQAAYPATNPVSTSDICSTIYRALGIDHELLVHDQVGRPQPREAGLRQQAPAPGHVRVGDHRHAHDGRRAQEAMRKAALTVAPVRPPARGLAWSR